MDADIIRRKEMIHVLRSVAVQGGRDVDTDMLLKLAMGLPNHEIFEFIYCRFDIRSIDPQLLLFYAVHCGAERVVHHLIQQNTCDINKPMNDWRIIHESRHTESALSLAWDPAVVRILLDAKADVNPGDSLPVLTGACRRLQPEAVQLLLLAGGPVNVEFSGDAAADSTVGLPTTPLSVGISPLEQAITALRRTMSDKTQQIPVINQLLSVGARTRSLRNGASAMVTACQDSSFSSRELDSRFRVICALHVSDPGMLSLSDNDGMTPLHYAVAVRSLPTVELLLKLGANVNPAHDHNKPSLSVISTLIRGNPKHAGESGPSDALSAVRPILRVLLDAGADPLSEGTDSPLLWLCAASGEDFSDGDVAAIASDMLEAIAYRPVAADNKTPGTMIDGEEEEKGEGRGQKRVRTW
jgi:ankyrin repeat protein